MKHPKVTRLAPEVCTNYRLLPNEKLLSIEVPSSNPENTAGLVGILTAPPSSLLTEEQLRHNPTSRGKHHPPTHKLAVFLHGSGGHKNYCYQAMAAQSIASKLGYYSFRIDFRGCGDSQDTSSVIGRSVADEIYDLDTVYDVFKDGSKHEEIGIDLRVCTLIGHSRGSGAMFQWAIKEQKNLDAGETYRFVPNLINCSGRWRSDLLMKRHGPEEEDERWELSITQYRFGKYSTIPWSKDEIQELASQSFTAVETLDPEIHVLSIYGIEDHIVPVDDASYYANALGQRHHLEFIPGADHNFYGTQEITEESMEHDNPEKYPLTKAGKVNWNFKVTDIITERLHTSNDSLRFKKSSCDIYALPRFKDIDGVDNFRDIGGWRTRDMKRYVKVGLIFRSGELSNITESGVQELQRLGVHAIFDLRSRKECEKKMTSVAGAEVFHISIGHSTLRLLSLHPELITSWYGWKYVYEDLLIQGAEAFRAVLLFIRDNPTTTIVISSSAGKDRVGLLTMIILLLAGVDTQVICRDYELSTSSTSSRLRKDLKSILNSHTRDPLTPEQMVDNILSARSETLVSTIETLQHRFGVIEGYSCKDKLGLSEFDLSTIRINKHSVKVPLQPMDPNGYIGSL